MDNIKNKVLKKKSIENLVNKFVDIYELKVNGVSNFNSCVKINNIKNIQKAFIHKSFSIIDNEYDSDSYSCIEFSYNFTNYERIEFLGDKVIDLITAEFLFDKYPDKDQGFLTDLKSRLVRKESLADLGLKLGFKDLMMISSHIERIDGRNNPRYLEDILESFVGILYKDQGSDISLCKKFILGVYTEYIDLDDIIKNNINYKASLLHYFHSKGYSHPVYNTLYYIGPTFSRIFTCVIFIPKEKYLYDPHVNLSTVQKEIIDTFKAESGHPDISDTQAYESLIGMMKNGTLVGMGKAGTKKMAEQECSKNCLLNLKIPLNK